jgi:hypothetical protein
VDLEGPVQEGEVLFALQHGCRLGGAATPSLVYVRE